MACCPNIAKVESRGIIYFDYAERKAHYMSFCSNIQKNFDCQCYSKWNIYKNVHL